MYGSSEVGLPELDCIAVCVYIEGYFVGKHFLHLLQYKANLVKSFETSALPSFDTMKLKPIIDTSFDLVDIGKAHALMESNRNVGKILLEVIKTTTKEEL